MKIIKKIFKTAYSLFLLVLILFFLATTFSLIPAPGGFRVFVVQSGSMEPAIKTGSLAATKAENSYRDGQIITYLAKPKTKMAENGPVVMHRIIENMNENGKTYLTTKGDANQGNDPDPVLPEQVLGRVLFAIPYAGYGVAFARTLPGFLLLLVLPAAAIIGSEALNIKRELDHLLQNKKKAGKKTKKKKLAKIFTTGLGVIWLVTLPAIGSLALFSDEERSTGVLLSTGNWPKKPELTCDFRGEKNMFHFNVFNHNREFEIFSYELTYETDGRVELAIGQGIDIEDEFEREIFLGTCSGSDCVPDGNFGELKLKVMMGDPERKRLGCRWQWQENDWHELEFIEED